MTGRQVMAFILHHNGCNTSLIASVNNTSILLLIPSCYYPSIKDVVPIADLFSEINGICVDPRIINRSASLGEPTLTLSLLRSSAGYSP